VRQKDQQWTVKVELAANKDEVSLAPDADIKLLLPMNVDIDKEIDRVVTIYENDLFAPITQGQVLGEISIIYKGEIMGSAKLVAMSDVEPSNVLLVLDQIKNIVSRPWFAASVIIFIVLFAVYIAFSLLRRSRRERKRFY
jgi:D-alanyl-D-alanine carboxypeptidase (penicillin-binding protein 5/6)